MEDKEKEFTRIVHEHKSRIYTVCYMFSDDSDQVADLFQEILINLWKGFSGFRGDSSISTWIWRISLNMYKCFEEKGEVIGDCQIEYGYRSI